MLFRSGGGELTWYKTDGQYYSYNGGAGGTLIGESGTSYSSSYIKGEGGMQTAGGSGFPNAGGFGYGSGYAPSYHNIAGGGGGYYGGGSGGTDLGVNQNTGYASGGGGSSFMSGYAGVNAVTSNSSSTHTNNTNHYSGKYFIKGQMIAGGNTGNVGWSKITYYGSNEPPRINSEFNNVRYIKNCINGSSANVYNHWIELQAIKDGQNLALNKTVTGTSPQLDSARAYTYIVDGKIDNVTPTSGHGRPTDTGLQCITVDLGTTYNLDEIAVWHYFVNTTRSYNENVTSVSSNGTNWTDIMGGSVLETSTGQHASVWDNLSIGISCSSQTLNSGTSGTAYTSNAFPACTLGSGSYTYSLVSGYPTGATINSSNRTISFPASTSAGTYNVVVKGTDNSTGGTATATMTIVINKATLSSSTYSYTGTKSTGTDTNGKFYVKLIGDGTLTVTGTMDVDIFLVGGGGGGGGGTATGATLAYGGGGGGQAVISSKTLTRGTSYVVDIGSGGGSNSNGSATTISALSLTAAGGKKGTSSAGGASGGSTGTGGTPTYATASGSGNSNSATGGSGGQGMRAFNNSTIGSTYYGGGGGGGAVANSPNNTTPAVNGGSGGTTGGGKGGAVGFRGNDATGQYYCNPTNCKSDGVNASSYGSGGGGGVMRAIYSNSTLTTTGGSGYQGIVIIRAK